MTASVPPGTDAAAAAQAAFCACLLDEFARGGMADLVVCPGSRSTPLVLAALATPAIRVHVRLDERSAGFFAIGRALATGLPVGVVVTSGTAAAELTASVVEADLAGVPVVVITADRPPELRGTGAAQTIDQVKLYGGAVRRYEEPGPIREDSWRWWRPLAARLLAAAVDGRGPVHLNLSLVEPLDAAPSSIPEGRPARAPWRTSHAGATKALEPFAGLAGQRGLFIAGRGGGDPLALTKLAATHGWPLLADPLCGARLEHPNVIASFDALVRDHDLAERLCPEVVVLLGAAPSSRPLAEALVAWSPRVIAVSSSLSPQDPSGVVSDHVVATPASWVLAALDVPPLGCPVAHLERWQLADAAVQRCFDERCGVQVDEPSVARLLSRELGDVALVVSNSMPVRDLESFGAKSPAPPRVIANRGANGIDGVVSTVLGVASRARAVGLLGDLAFLHDAGSLADGVGEHGGSCVLVVVDNRGGGIFSFLPQRRSVPNDHFERAFGTPPTASIASVAAGYGAAVRVVKDLESLRLDVLEGLESGGVTVVIAEVPDRDQNVEVHRELTDLAVRAAKSALGA
ncbi:MAG TPA: 2-succinyl-5-enolpyruvyl-6-hydroxy-3-cyclohexene-1-carboxylic-acid synthase [Acidimicrobiales bacterium]|nr:2-succinyl-5-enolpyruvyl-6-hydroxy-3-cyclohexene-1-carboxylic-acid synthase [Acidimicrobiales bacterium]